MSFAIGLIVGLVCRLWWKGLAALLVLTVILTAIGTVGASFDPLFPGWSAITPASVALGLARQFLVLLIGYAVGAGARLLWRRLKGRAQ